MKIHRGIYIEDLVVTLWILLPVMPCPTWRASVFLSSWKCVLGSCSACNVIFIVWFFPSACAFRLYYASVSFLFHSRIERNIISLPTLLTIHLFFKRKRCHQPLSGFSLLLLPIFSLSLAAKPLPLAKLGSTLSPNVRPRWWRTGVKTQRSLS